jgi:drug/metabolite transporter (DMT)-like permease
VSRTTVHIVSFFLHSGVLYYSTEANVNFSLIINLYSLTPFSTAIAFYCFFREKVNKNHGIGMFFIFACALITSQSQGALDPDTNQRASVPVYVPVTLALMATICFTMMSTIGRYVVTEGKGVLSSQQLVADCYILQSVIMLSLLGIQLCFFPTIPETTQHLERPGNTM